ncbi:MAG: hybrid sensor histidine kinase/response regulator [Anaerolineae bacterium]|nr:hybrid sensor histidine kinase/response regulator [Anaerolineae bacterium]
MSTPPTILNVEDIPENRNLIRRILESAGYQVVDAANALEGIDKASQLCPDLILMDINLPDLDGFTAVTRIRSFAHLKKVPIIALTARSVGDDRERAKAIGCDSYLSKPVDFDELITEVDRYLTTGHQEEAITPREYYLQEQSVALIEELERKFTELQTAYERLKHLEEAKSNFISVVSHELRTPLTVIHSYTQMLEMLPFIQADEGAKDLLAGIAKGSTRLQEIINDMVSVVRVELSRANFEVAPVSIRSIIKTIVEEQLPTTAERKITLGTEVANDLPMVNGDFKQLHSAITRIVGNAIKYTPDGGWVTISAKSLQKTNGPDNQSFVEVIVADSGVGIALDKQKLIFDKFSTAENVSQHSTGKTKFMGGGAGLGLTIAKGIIESHQGRIWVESEGYDSEKLPGSKFYILLPAL